MPAWTKTDRDNMQLALELASRGQGLVEPNPMVGCVIVKNGRIIGRGYHRRFGGPHAEVFALREAGRRARGAVAYVTLEPCNHTGKTPPCTEALIAAGISRVVAAMQDPNPIVSGSGVRRLRQAGLHVDMGLLHDQAAALNAPFIKYHQRRRPYVILKWAQSIDGKIATRSGDSKWITSLQSRRESHRLRSRVDAVLVGVDTVIVDDPDLTARLVRPKRIATRIVVDSSLRIPLTARVVRSGRKIPTIIVAVRAAGRGPAFEKKRRSLERAGCEVLLVRHGKHGADLADLLDELRKRDMTNILVEGGGRVLGAFLDQNLADEAMIFVAPKLIGGEDAPSPLRGLGPASMKDLPRAVCRGVVSLGPDFCYNIGFAST